MHAWHFGINFVTLTPLTHSKPKIVATNNNTNTGLNVYRASAGSGKTFQLTLQYVVQLLRGASHAQILAVTFTNDATAEMKGRILAALYGLAHELKDADGYKNELLKMPDFIGKAADIQTQAQAALTAILHDYGHFGVGTIDSFLQRVLRNLAHELGVGSHFNIDLDTDSAIRDAVKALIDKAAQDAQLMKRITDFVGDEMDEGRRFDISDKLETFGKMLFNEAYQQNAAKLHQQFDNNPNLLNASKQQCWKIREIFESRLNEIAEHFFKFLEQHNIDVQDLSYKTNNGGYSYFSKIRNKTYGDAMGKRTTDCLTKTSAWISKPTPAQEKIITNNLIPLLQEVEDYRNQRDAQGITELEKYHSACLLLGNLHQLGLLKSLFDIVSTQNAENNRFMLADTAYLLSGMLGNDDASFVYERIGTTTEHVMIDEFQDTSRLQWQNFKTLLQESTARGKFSMIVGDVKQSIYRWRNGDWSILNDFDRQGMPFANITLGTNHRSHRDIVAFNNDIFPKMVAAVNTRFNNEFNCQGKETSFSKAYKDVCQDIKKADEPGYVSVDFCEKMQRGSKDPDPHLVLLIEKLQHLQQGGVKPESVCLLCRSNQEIRDTAEYLRQHRNDTELTALRDNGYMNVISDEAFRLSASPALQLVVTAMRMVAANETNAPAYAKSVALQHHANKDVDAKLNDPNLLDKLLPEALRSTNLPKLRMLSLYELTHVIVRSLNLDNSGHDNFLLAFFDGIAAHTQQHASNLTDFIDYWDEQLSTQSVTTANVKGMRITTVHKSKGLEFHTVILPFCDWDMAPKSSPFRTNIVWCTADDGKSTPPFDIAFMPIEYKSAMGQSVFAGAYQKETEMLLMDNLNALYVAFTRPKCNLIIIAEKSPQKPDSALRANILLHGALDLQDHQDHYERGTLVPTTAESIERTDNVFDEKAITTTCEVQLTLHNETRTTSFNASAGALRLANGKTEDYVDEEARMEGVRLHTILAHIHTAVDVDAAVDALVQQGTLEQMKADAYKQKVHGYVAQRPEWFDDRYQTLNECTILTQDGQHRPDRVICAKDTTIVIDYKFGRRHNAHCQQVAVYMTLLRQMGYPDVQGYVWYMNNNMEVVPVTA